MFYHRFYVIYKILGNSFSSFRAYSYMDHVVYVSFPKFQGKSARIEYQY